MSQKQEQDKIQKKKAGWLRRRGVSILLVVALCLGVFFGLRFWRYSTTHISTDDATISSDVAQITPQVAGTVQQIYVDENQHVHAGQLLVSLDDSSYRTSVAQAQANLDAAIAAAKATGMAGGNTGATADVARANAGIQAARVNTQRAQAAVEDARTQVASARANAAAAQAQAESAERDVARYNQLYHAGAISAQQADKARTAARTAEAQLAAARQQIVARQADYQAAQEQVAASQTAVVQAQTQLPAAQQSGNQAEAKVEQARAALQAVQIQLNNTRILAPTDGVISNKAIQVGTMVQPGTPLMALVQDERPWVVANYKETQLTQLVTGEKADITVDALPGMHFAGRVDSLSPATGSTFALLPPDNATGNFTKIVQRVPIKVTLDPDQPHLDQLRAGMSVSVAIATG